MPLLRAVAALLGFQLVGELISRFTGLPVPGPVMGLLLLALYLVITAYRTGIRPTFVDMAADGVLGILGLLFVPAGVGVIQQMPVLKAHWLAIIVVLVVSTVITMVVTAGTFVLVSRLLGDRP